jgi:hypothetical protein
MHKAVLTILLLLLGCSLFSQETEIQSDTLRKDALKVFMETSNYYRSTETGDYIRREIPYINYVRDIKDADLYIIFTRQMTGSGGWEYTCFLVGQHDFEGMRDTLLYTTAPDETEEGRRSKEVRALKMGLMRYVARTPLSQYIDIRFTEPMSETVSTDKWHNWVFRPSLSAFIRGEKTYTQQYINTSFTADKITEAWKFRTRLSYNYRVQKFDVGEEIIKSTYDTKYAGVQLVRSLTDHWSVGGQASVSASTYNNEDLSLKLLPSIEYDLFPYSQSTRRQLRIQYSIGYNYKDYIDTTIYNRTEEHLWLHRLSTAYQVIQKWGSINVDVTYSNYLHAWSKNNLDFGGEINLRIAKGLSLDLFGSYSIIHDQLGLVKGDVSAEDILLQIREMETQFSYYLSVGFSYTFGSIYNNVVNPRFGSYFY